ncbi:hypothetical protein V6C03_09745 [Methyloligella sp. 2.7D]|uniref:hypothetical protein n=1 Tax=unclassified Methyloligella TaxID=2625955 RepID=UPI00157D724F|nr:hypothetical protein [Methyloligella sp. GL2]QKP77871.1 hypothetical protein HT051_10710 [Methyloligella sp. GL2]
MKAILFESRTGRIVAGGVLALLLFQAILVAVAGVAGVPGVYLVELRGKPRDGQEAISAPLRHSDIAPSTATRISPPPGAAPGDDASAANPPEMPPEPGESSGEGEVTTEVLPWDAIEPDDDLMAPPPKPEAAGTNKPTNGPVGWQGPDGAGSDATLAPGEDEMAKDDASKGDASNAPPLDGPIQLNINDAVNELNAEPEKDEEDKKNEEKGAEQSSKAAPSEAGASSEALPWDAIDPDSALLEPVPGAPLKKKVEPKVSNKSEAASQPPPMDPPQAIPLTTTE